MARILVIEDEPGLARALKLGLQDEMHVVDVEHDGQEGLFTALGGEHELIILDRMLPRFSGDELCRRLRLDGMNVPVLMLTAKDRPRDVVEGLDAGADDYLSKPFAFEELLARIRALLRRSAGQAAPRFQVGALELDPAAHRAWWAGEEVVLTTKEFQLLEAMARRRGWVLSKLQLAQAAWDMEPTDNVIEVHISHLRETEESMKRLLPFLLLACNGDKADDTGDSNLIDGILLPDADAATWVDGVDNSWFPLPVGAKWSYASQTDEGLETVEVEVLSETREVNGVTATVVYDVEYLDGEILEETWDWFAQDDEGNVWYLGEDTCEYEGGACVSTEGAWEWGVDGAKAGIVMPAEPEVDGQPYFQEYYKGEAEDVGEVIATGESITVPAGSFEDCIRTADTSHIDPELEEEKLFCPGIGNVYVWEEDAEVELVSYEGLTAL